MDAKLTLKLDKDTIDRAKEYAQRQNISLSRLVEAMLDSLTSEKEKGKISPNVQQLIGVLDLPEDFDYKEDRAAYLTKKYLHD
ncbi:MAG: DUF6364 family protein [Bacteroidia bacterium]|nr:DUF6364 family protein [Bacteroidia bacterium]